MTDHPTGTREEHRQARLRLLEAEKEHTRRGDELAGMFDGRSQLLVYGGRVHLNQRDVTMVCASCAPLDRIQAYQRRMGWSLDAFNATFQLLDRAPRGRDEDALPVPVAWVRRHDEYGQAEPAPAG